MKKDDLKELLKNKLPEYLDIVHGIKQPYTHFTCLNKEHEGGDSEPSMILNKKNPQYVKCFGRCGVNWDIFSLIKNDYGLESYPEQVKKACEVLGIDDENATFHTQTRPKTDTKPQEPATLDLAEYVKTCAEQIDQAAGYLQSRGISLETAKRFKVGFDDYYILHTGKTRQEVETLALETGRMMADNLQAVIIPNDNGSINARFIDNSKMRYNKQGNGIFNMAAVRIPGPVFITEGSFDALSFEEIGYNALALNSVNNMNMFIEALKNETVKADLIIALDNDAAGLEKVPELKEALRQQGIINVAAPIKALYGHFKDANEYLQNDREGFTATVNAVLKALKDGQAAEEQRQRQEAQAEYRQRNQAAAFLGDLRALMDDPKQRYIETGFKLLDDELSGGLYPGLYILGAVSSLGKTTYILQMADQIAEAGRDVLIFSLEMDRNELMTKSISRETAKICLWQRKPLEQYASTSNTIITRQKREKCGETQKLFIENSFRRYSEKIAQNVYIIEAEGKTTAATIREAVENHISVTGNKPAVFIDYLQLIQPADPRMTEKQQADYNVSELKRISRAFDLPVIAISSFNRAAYSKAADLDSFKESGGIEYGADVLLALQFEKQSDRTDQEEEKKRSDRRMELKVIKNRNGKTGGTVKLTYYAAFNIFIETE